MSLDKIHNELLDYVNLIYLSTHKTPQINENFLLSITGTARPFINSFMKIYGYTKNDYTNILIKILGFPKDGSYQVCDEDYFECVNSGLIPDGKEELNQTVDLE